jgi:hypothetical protein
MAWSHPPEVKAAVREMVEGTTLTFAAIAAACSARACATATSRS